MNVTFEPKAEHWRGRGAPPKPIPPQVSAAADRTYRTGQVGRSEIGPDEEEEAAELASLLRCYARRKGLRMKLQRHDDVLLFEMVDKQPAPKRKAGKGEHGRGSRAGDDAA